MMRVMGASLLVSKVPASRHESQNLIPSTNVKSQEWWHSWPPNLAEVEYLRPH